MIQSINSLKFTREFGLWYVEHDELKSGSTGSIVTAGVVKAQWSNLPRLRRWKNSEEEWQKHLSEDQRFDILLVRIFPYEYHGQESKSCQSWVCVTDWKAS